MLSTAITDLLSIEYEGLFDDSLQCEIQLMAKQNSGDADIPPELTQRHVCDFGPDVFIWVTQKHIDNNSAHLIARDVMSNIGAGLSGSYEQVVEMLANAGLVPQAAQIWRANVAGDIDAYRYYRGVHKTVERFNALSEEKQAKAAPRSVPDSLQESIARDFPKMKKRALDALDDFESWSAHHGVADQHAAQIALWRGEVESGQKPKLPPADKTPMSEALFWQIIEDAQSASENETVLKIEDQLMAYAAKAIRDAGKVMQSHLAAAYREDVWGVPYLLEGGCSDDAFDDFRGWLVLRGRTVFDDVMRAPDQFDPQLADGANFAAGASLAAAFENAYMTRTGKPLILPKLKLPKCTFDEDNVAELLPNLTAKLDG